MTKKPTADEWDQDAYTSLEHLSSRPPALPGAGSDAPSVEHSLPNAAGLREALVKSPDLSDEDFCPRLA